jgi:hypothetical protein
LTVSGKCPLKNPARLTLRGVFAFCPSEIAVHILKIAGLIVLMIVLVVSVRDIYRQDRR